jgi:hypothetical protein
MHSKWLILQGGLIFSFIFLQRLRTIIEETGGVPSPCFYWWDSINLAFTGGIPSTVLLLVVFQRLDLLVKRSQCYLIL